MKVEPFVKRFCDYHYIDEALECYQDLVPNMKSEEIAFDGDYWGLFYTGRKSSNKRVKELLLESGFTYENEYSEIYSER